MGLVVIEASMYVVIMEGILFYDDDWHYATYINGTLYVNLIKLADNYWAANGITYLDQHS